MSSASALWRDRDFVRLWLAQSVSAFGARITREGLPIAAVLTLGASPAQLGLLSALSNGPALIVGLAAGGFVDRNRRRGLMMAADLVRALVLATIPIAALLQDLSQRGMLDKTLVILMGEFGRTPRVNPRGGRDHYSRCRFAAFAGGGVKGGQLIGKSDATGSSPAERPVSVEDIASSVYTSLGIDYHKQYMTPTGRPIHLATGGEPIKELWG